MECLHGGFVSGFGSETPFKTASFTDEFPAVTGDDLFVDELLDFSNDFEEDEMEPPQPQKLDEPEEDEPDEAKTCLEKPEKSVLSVKDDFGPLPESELSVPAEGLESLEWLSHFVEDSFSDYSLAGKLLSATNRPEPETSTKEQQACFITQVHTKARTKRARTGIRVWPVLSSSFTDSSTSSSSSTSATSFSVPNFPWPVHSQTGEFFKPPTKKQPKKKKPADAAGVGSTQPRRCGHCGVTKTPQWRAGPMGSKTLCNACGVRYKSGRLLPEYRPACSPTFSNELHSNNHRKVLEMRRKKETDVEAGPGLDPPVQSF